MKSRTEHGGHVRPSTTNFNCKPSGMLDEPVDPEYCDEFELRMEGARCAFGLEYQKSSSFGGIAIRFFADKLL